MKKSSEDLKNAMLGLVSLILFTSILSSAFPNVCEKECIKQKINKETEYG